MLCAATLLAAVCSVITYTTTKEPDKSNLLINDLRRTLMRDNIDYYAEEKSETTANLTTNLSLDETEENDDTLHSKNIEEQEHKISNFYVPKLSKKSKKNKKINSHEHEKPKRAEHKISKMDLLYYMDDKDLPYKPQEHGKSQINDYSSMRTNKYKVLKLKHNYRRNEQARLIQEESKEKVVIANLNKGPIPELRLPRSRRQYMHDHGKMMADEEDIPPPVVNTSDPEAAAEEEYSATEVTTTPEIIKEAAKML